MVSLIQGEEVEEEEAEAGEVGYMVGSSKDAAEKRVSL